MNLFDYKPHEKLNKSSTLEVRDIFTEELLVTVDVLSMMAEPVRNAATIRDKAVAIEGVTEEEKETANAVYIASMIAGWKLENGNTFGGKALKYTPENAVTVASSSVYISNMVIGHAAKVKNYGDKAKKS